MKTRVLGIVIGLILIAGIVGAVLGNLLVTQRHPLPPGVDPDRFDWESFKIFQTVKTAVTAINVTISIVLIAIYVRIYRKTQSEFTLGLIVMMLALLLYAITSSPLISVIFGFRSFGLGPFSLIPDLCAAMALSVLLYLSLE